MLLMLLIFCAATVTSVAEDEPAEWTVLFYICGIAGLLPLVMIFSQHPFVRINLQLLVLNPLWLFLMSPWTKWKHRWNVALVMVILFFVGNIFQSYAEGMNILALSLLVRIISNRLKRKE